MSGTSPSEPGRPRRPARLTPRMMDFFAAEHLDPAVIIQVADESAAALVRAGRASDDPQITERLVALVDEIGLDTVAELWAQRPARSLPGGLWRLYALREWIRANPVRVSREYAEGLRFADVAAVIAGVAEPPGPQAVCELADEVLRGVFEADIAIAFERAAAFAAVLAAGRGAGDTTGEAMDESWAQARGGASLLTMAHDLVGCAKASRRGDFGLGPVPPSALG